MTLADQFKDDVSNILLNLQDFAEEIIYRPGGDAGRELVVTALVQRGPLLVRGVDQGRTAKWDLSIWLKSADVQPMVKRGDILLIPPKRGEDPQAYTPAVDLTPPHVPHMVRWGLIVSRT